MPITPRQDLMFHLAGTVRLPSPPPATGCVWVVASPKDKAPALDDLVLRIVHRISGRLYVERVVRFSDVRAIKTDWAQLLPAAPPDANAPKKTDYRYKSSAEYGADALKFAQTLTTADGVWLTNAVAYVKELAPVVLVAEAALTASESAEYYPPIVGDGSLGAGRGLGTVISRLLREAIACDSNKDDQPPITS